MCDCSAGSDGRLVRDKEGNVSVVKVADVIQKLVILLLGVFCTILMSNSTKASDERDANKDAIHKHISELREDAARDREAILALIALIDSRVAVVEGSRWRATDQAGHERDIATRFEKIWERVVALENRPMPQAPPDWFKEQVDELGDKVDQNTKLIIAIKTKLETMK